MAVISWPIRLQDVGVWISAEDRTDIQSLLAQNLTGARIYVTSLLLRKSGGVRRANIYLENMTKCFVLAVTDQYQVQIVCYLET